MRSLIWLTVVLATLWGGWWVLGSRGVKTAAETWFADQSAQGIEAGYEDLAVWGFPSRFDLTVTAPHLFDPASGLGWRAPFAQVFAMSWKPWHLIAALPGGQVISSPDQDITLDATRLMASLLLVPGLDLTLNEAVIEGEGLAVSPSVNGVAAVDKLVALIRAEDGSGARYRLGVKATGLVFDVPDLPPSKAEVRLDAHLTLSAPLDRLAGHSHPAPRRVDLTEARLIWGDLNLRATGSLAPDLAGYAAGQIDITVENWRKALPLLQATGLIAPEFVPVLERGLEVMAAEGANPTVLTLPLIAQGGRISLGPLPMGTAPYWGD